MKFLSSKNNKDRILILSITISLLFHAGLLLIPLHLKKQEEVLRIVRLDPETLPEKQVIDDEGKPLSEETPDETRFLSKHNRKVEQETKARHSGPTQNNNVQVKRLVDPQEENATKKILNKDDMLLALHKPEAQRQTLEKKPENKTEESLVEKTFSSLNPSTTDDYLPDVEESEETALNSKEFLFYSFYARIKEKLRVHWTDNLKTIMREQQAYRTIASNQDYITKLRIQLRDNGELKNVFVIASSGDTSLDNAAVRAFEQAAPFPNPPKNMIESDGSVKLRWDFIIEANRGSRIKVLLSRI
ncbi:MAG: TonB family protein [Deltaproteobacteria bacterium]|nr:TonB family protein [Deltaproteobacteria bacterium]